MSWGQLSRFHLRTGWSQDLWTPERSGIQGWVEGWSDRLTQGQDVSVKAGGKGCSGGKGESCYKRDLGFQVSERCLARGLGTRFGYTVSWALSDSQGFLVGSCAVGCLKRQGRWGFWNRVSLLQQHLLSFSHLIKILGLHEEDWLSKSEVVKTHQVVGLWAFLLSSHLPFQLLF